MSNNIANVVINQHALQKRAGEGEEITGRLEVTLQNILINTAESSSDLFNIDLISATSFAVGIKTMAASRFWEGRLDYYNKLENFAGDIPNWKPNYNVEKVKVGGRIGVIRFIGHAAIVGSILYDASNTFGDNPSMPAQKFWSNVAFAALSYNPITAPLSISYFFIDTFIGWDNAINSFEKADNASRIVTGKGIWHGAKF